MKYNNPIVGQKLGHWIVISAEVKKGSDLGKINKNTTYWKVRCKCGREVWMNTTNLHKYQKPCKSCCQVTRYGEMNTTYIKVVEKRAKELGYEYDLDIKYIYDLYLKQNKKCKLSDLPIGFKNGFRCSEPQTASLDRIDSSKGYVKGNVQWLHKDVNKLKNSFDESYFIEICKRISECQKEKSSNVFSVI